MTYLNEATALAALVLQCLLLRGFLPHVKLSPNTATSLLARAIFIASALATVRLGYYDLWRPLASAAGWIDWPGMSMRSQMWNAGFNAGLSLGSYYALRALHSALPACDRNQYTWLTAPFYPSRCVLIFARRRD